MNVYGSSNLDIGISERGWLVTGSKSAPGPCVEKEDLQHLRTIQNPPHYGSADAFQPV